MEEDGIPTNLLNDRYTITGDGSNFVNSQAYSTSKNKTKNKRKYSRETLKSSLSNEQKNSPKKKDSSVPIFPFLTILPHNLVQK